MDMYPKYKSKFGYQIGNNQIDSYGVDHSGFSLQDELEYQYAREEKENKLLEQLKSRGITQDLPQYTTDFWGDSANNYGFGTTDIAANIEKMQNNTTPIPVATPTPQQPVQINKSLQNGIQNNLSSARNNVKNFAQNAINVIAPYTPYNIGQKIGELAADTKIAYDYWKKMNQTGKQIVKTFGSGQGANIEKMQNTTTPIPVATAISQQQPSNDPNCYVEFDGNNVDLYKYGQSDGNRLLNGQLQHNLSGQSGDDYHQSGIYQNVANHGPIPEGTYYANQDQRQNITVLDAAIGAAVGLVNQLGANVDMGRWKGGPISWGTKRVWLRPDVSTNTYGRSGFSIHGGLTKGSAGCIDIPWQTGKLSDYLDGCQDSVPVYVKYPKNW